MLCKYPTHVLRSENIDLFDTVLKSDGATLPYKVQIINILANYLKADEERMLSNLVQQKVEEEELEGKNKLDIKSLKGQSEEMLESSISSSVMQRYLESITRLLLHPNEQVKLAAFEMTYLVLKQGLVHPLQVGGF